VNQTSRCRLFKRVSTMATVSLAIFAPTLAMAQAAALPQPANNWVVLAAVVPGCLFVLGIIAIALNFSYKHERERLLAIERLLEKGHEVPRALLRPPEIPREVHRRIDLHQAIMLLCLGLGGGSALWLVTNQWRIAAWALIFLFLSAGKFINWHLAGKPLPSAAPDDAPGGRG
jgi:hypothetical protein